MQMSTSERDKYNYNTGVLYSKTWCQGLFAKSTFYFWIYLFISKTSAWFLFANDIEGDHKHCVASIIAGDTFCEGNGRAWWFAGQINLASNYHVYLFHYASRWYLLFIVAVGGKWVCRFWAGADWMYPLMWVSAIGGVWDSFKKGLWAYGQNLVQNHVNVTLTIMIRSGDKFARVTATELSCHVQICDLMGLLQS